MLKCSQIKLITLFINKIKDNLTNINYMIKKYQKEKLVVKMNLITNFSFKDSLKQEIVFLKIEQNTLLCVRNLPPLCSSVQKRYIMLNKNTIGISDRRT